MAARGYNTFHGADSGPPPPGTTIPQVGYATAPVPFPPPLQSQPYTYPALPQQQPVMATTQPWQMYPPSTPWTDFTRYYGMPTHHYGGPGANPYMPMVPINNEIPGLNFRNPSGGIGLPPGYDYLFPPEHTVIHVFKPSTTSSPPWQGTTFPSEMGKFIKCFVPCNLTVLELMGRLGLDNSDAKKNVVHEVVEKGNGAWAKGFTIKGDDKDRIKKTLKAMGWDSTRIGVPGRKPVVWLYITKN